MKIRLGTRGSKLALKQADLVKDALSNLGVDVDIVIVKTTGDIILDKPLYDIGGKALFLKELEEQLINQKIDIAVHSYKDVPALLPDGLVITAVLKQEDPRDVLISEYVSIENLPKNAKIGTSSVRRLAQIHKIRPDIEIVPIRGNINSRIDSIKGKGLDGIILAAAGLLRLDMFGNNFHFLSEEEMIPAIGQGIIAVEARSNDYFVLDILSKINHKETWELSRISRGFMERLNGDCKTAMGVSLKLQNDNIDAKFMLSYDLNNIEYLSCSYSFLQVNNFYRFGQEAANHFLGKTRI